MKKKIFNIVFSMLTALIFLYLNPCQASASLHELSDKEKSNLLSCINEVMFSQDDLGATDEEYKINYTTYVVYYGMDENIHVWLTPECEILSCELDSACLNYQFKAQNEGYANYGIDYIYNSTDNTLEFVKRYGTSSNSRIPAQDGRTRTGIYFYDYDIEKCLISSNRDITNAEDGQTLFLSSPLLSGIDNDVYMDSNSFDGFVVFIRKNATVIMCCAMIIISLMFFLSFLIHCLDSFYKS